MIYFLLIPVLLLLVGLLLLWLARRGHMAAGLPDGEVISTDMSDWRALEKPLISRRYGLVGKPDYLLSLSQGGKNVTVPVEVKSRRRPPRPFDSHIMQLATYCLLVEDVFKQQPPCGYLRYADATIKIPFDDALRHRVLQTAEAIRRARTATTVERQHEEMRRCIGCGYRHECDEALS